MLPPTLQHVPGRGAGPLQAAAERQTRPSVFRDGAYWFHTRLFNRGNPEERWLLVLQYSLLDNVDVYMRYPDGRVDHLASGDKLPFSRAASATGSRTSGSTCRSAARSSCWCARRAKARCRRRW
jgi:hypothetical protein